jgi:hypothetical protein
MDKLALLKLHSIAGSQIRVERLFMVLMLDMV